MKNKIAKGLYLINSITSIFIGLLHTNAHFTELVTEQLKEKLNHPIVVTGVESNIWDLWQGMSFMMGILLIIVGLLHLVILKGVDEKSYPPIGGSLVMILMLLFVIYSGFSFFGSMQIYGGSTGLILQTICLILSIRK